MTIKGYSPVSWTGGEPIAASKLQRMATNDQLIAEAMPKFLFKSGVNKTAGIKIFAGTIVLPVSKNPDVGAPIYFDNLFSVGCRPVVTLTIGPRGTHQRFHKTVRGLARGSSAPDHRGAHLSISSDRKGNKSDQVAAAVLCHVIAVGW